MSYEVHCTKGTSSGRDVGIVRMASPECPVGDGTNVGQDAAVSGKVGCV